MFAGCCICAQNSNVTLDIIDFYDKYDFILLCLLVSNAIFSFTVFGKVISVLSHIGCSMLIGIILYTYHALCENSVHAFLLFTVAVALFSFLTTVFYTSVFSYSKRATAGKRALFATKPCALHIISSIIFVYILYSMFGILFNNFMLG